VFTDPVRSKNCESGKRNKNELEPEEKGDAEKDRRDRIVERDPERQKTGNKQQKELHCPPEISERATSSAADLMSSAPSIEIPSASREAACFAPPATKPRDRPLSR
jgi:hypothetical protein